MTTPSMNPFKRKTPPPAVSDEASASSKKPNGSGPPSPPRVPRLRPLFFRETQLLDQTRSKLEEAESMRPPALEALEQARQARVEQMAQYPNRPAPPPTDIEEAGLKAVEQLIKDRTAAVAVAEETLAKARERGPTDADLIAFEDSSRLAVERVQELLREFPIAVKALAVERARGRQMLGNGHECNSWPTEELERLSRGAEPLQDAASFGRYLDMLDGVVRERRRRAGPPKTERDFGLEGGKGELPPVDVAPEVAAEVEPTRDEPPAQSRPKPGEPATNKAERPSKGTQTAFGLAGGKVGGRD